MDNSTNPHSRSFALLCWCAAAFLGCLLGSLAHIHASAPLLLTLWNFRRFRSCTLSASTLPEICTRSAVCTVLEMCAICPFCHTRTMFTSYIRARIVRLASVCFPHALHGRSARVTLCRSAALCRVFVIHVRSRACCARRAYPRLVPSLAFNISGTVALHPYYPLFAFARVRCTLIIPRARLCYLVSLYARVPRAATAHDALTTRSIVIMRSPCLYHTNRVVNFSASAFQGFSVLVLLTTSRLTPSLRSVGVAKSTIKAQNECLTSFICSRSKESVPGGTWI